MKIFCFDWLYLIRNHLSFLFLSVPCFVLKIFTIKTNLRPVFFFFFLFFRYFVSGNIFGRVLKNPPFKIVMSGRAGVTFILRWIAFIFGIGMFHMQERQLLLSSSFKKKTYNNAVRRFSCFIFLCWIWFIDVHMYHNILWKFQNKMSKRNLLKICLLVTYPTDFCGICIHVYYGKKWKYLIIQKNND